jgi:hypothetical protein
MTLRDYVDAFIREFSEKGSLLHYTQTQHEKPVIAPTALQSTGGYTSTLFTFTRLHSQVQVEGFSLDWHTLGEGDTGIVLDFPGLLPIRYGIEPTLTEPRAIRKSHLLFPESESQNNSRFYEVARGLRGVYESPTCFAQDLVSRLERI